MTRFRFVEAEAAQFPVSLLCRVVGVTRQGYYAWKRRPAERAGARRPRAQRADHARSSSRRRRSTARRGSIRADARRRDPDRQEARRPADAAARDAWRRRQAAAGRAGRRCAIRSGPRHRISSTETSPGRSRTGSGSAISSTSRPGRASSSWPLCRTSSAAASSAGRCATTSKPSWSLDALGMAVSARGDDSRRRGRAFGSRVAIHELGLRQLRQAVGDRSLDGLDRRPVGQRRGRELLRLARERAPPPRALRRRASRPACGVFWYIECFYNPRRRHSSLGMLSPIEYEQQHQQEAIAA